MTTGVVVMAYGSPTSLDDIATYYTDIRRGAAPSDEQLAELSRRYEAIGGLSPLVERTESQIAAITLALEQIAPGTYETYYGAKHSEPKIERAVARAASDGVDAIVGLVLAPHYAAASVGEYLQRARSAADEAGLPSRFVERYGADPVLIDLLALRVLEALDRFADDLDHTEVVFTAHSLPLRSLSPDDRYEAEIAETAALVADKLALSHVRTGWQSAGMTPHPWLGPDVLEVLDDAAATGRRNVVICPCGFTSDHLEVLYDLDVVAARRARELGIGFARTRSLNDDARFATLLAQRIVTA
ncbi:MAG TPA: ferrochelatase [Acidimicrobiales bacterium]|nr:ferrochelatase [Acidimicrobiales bacterium]